MRQSTDKTPFHIQSPMILATGKKNSDMFSCKHDIYYHIPHIVNEVALFPVNEQLLKKVIAFALPLVWQVATRMSSCRTHTLL